MTSYAKGTSVPIIRTRGHIEELLQQHKATEVGLITRSDPPMAMVGFRITGWAVRMTVPLTMPPASRKGRTLRGPGRVRAEAQFARERWRALFITIKAKLISVAEGVETFEEAFLPHLVLAGGATVMESVRPQLGAGTALSDMPLQLGPGGRA